MKTELAQPRHGDDDAGVDPVEPGRRAPRHRVQRDAAPTARRSTSSRCSPTTSPRPQRSRRSARATRRCRPAPTSSSTTATPASAPTSARSRAAGKWVAGQYVVVFMNGCDTFAYVDERAQRRAPPRSTPTTPTGTKYIDIVTNAMPAFFHTMSRRDDGAVPRPARARRSPEDLRADLPQHRRVAGRAGLRRAGQHVHPGRRRRRRRPWAGLNESRLVTRNESKTLRRRRRSPPARYTFAMTGTGDADLYVRIGSAPTTTSVRLPPVQDRLERDLHRDARQPRRSST